MPGRFVLHDGAEALSALFSAPLAGAAPPLPNYNICPTDPILVVTKGRELRAMRWGFVPDFDPAPDARAPLINARCESVAEKPSFRWAIRHQRCLVPASGFYEWVKQGDRRLPYYVAPPGRETYAFAGLWQDWGQGAQKISTCAIITCAANDKLARLHHRQGVVIPRDKWGLWLGEAGHGAAVLMTPPPVAFFDYYRVDPAVNSNRAEGPELIAPLQSS